MNTLFDMFVRKPKHLADGGFADAISGVLGTKNTYQAKPAYTSTSPTQASTLATANAQATGGAGPTAGTLAQMSNLSNALQAASQGQGPNPALEQLRQATSANVNNAAGMAASARGVNPAVAARMAVDAGSQANQASAGQAATLAAEQQIQARNQLAQNLASTGNLQIGTQQAGTQLLGTAGGLDLSSQGINAQQAGHAADINAQVAAQNTATNQKLIGGILNGIGGAASSVATGGLSDLAKGVSGLFGSGAAGAAEPEIEAPVMLGPSAGAHGGLVPAKMADGGQTASATKQSPIYDYLDSAHGRQRAPATTVAPSAGAFASGGHIGNGSIHQVPVVLSPGEKVLPPGTTPRDAARKIESAPKVAGRAKVDGDSPRNDTEHGTLPAGSIVYPRSVVDSEDPEQAAASFTAALARRSGGRHLAAGGHAFAQPQVPAPTPAAPGATKRSTARGAGRGESRRRMSTSKEPKHREPDEGEG